MVSQLPFVRCLLLMSCVAAAAARQQSVQNSISSHPERRDFPNERLYRAYLVIQSFKNTITSDPKNITATWAGHDICGNTTYLGFYCTIPADGVEKLTVTSIIWNGFGLRAPKLQGFIDQLPDLAFFHAASNDFGHGIPRLDSLPFLCNLNVDIHFMFDTRKKGWGIIPAGFTDAKALLLNYNNLSGPLPANLGFSKLSYLALAHNKLTGAIPQSIGQAKDTLVEVLLLNNQLSGCLPHELGMLTKASVIDAGTNQLTGPIPSSFSCLSSVEQLNLAGNRLYGQVPDALCGLAGPAGRLANLTLSGNYFTSVGPACSALIKDGVLDIKRNCIPGFANQRGPAECASFLSKPQKCPAATAPVACPAAADARKNAPAPEGRVARDYSSYVTYATLHE